MTSPQLETGSLVSVRGQRWVVSEIVSLRIGSIQIGPHRQLECVGKGRKQRILPLQKNTTTRADVAAELLASLDEPDDTDQQAVEAARAQEIERRARRVLAGESAGEPWEDVRARLASNTSLDR